MLQSIKNYPQLWILTLIVLIVAIVVFIIAGKNKRETGDSPENLLSGRDIAELRKAFEKLNTENMSTVHGRELIYAIIANLEMKLDNEVDFADFNLSQQYIYTLWYFAQTITGRTMCVFFKEFGEPLTTLIVPAMTAIGRNDWAKIIQDGYDAYDENNENASCDKKTVDAINETFKNEYTRQEFYEACEIYINNNLGDFIDE